MPTSSSRTTANADELGESAPRWPAPVSLFLIACGLAISIYLTVEHYSGSASLACPDTATISCAKVTSSVQSSFLGIPVALLGLLFFTAMVPLHLPIAWRSPRRAVGLFRLGVWSAGVLFVAWLVYAELVLIGAICLWCTVIHVLTVAMFIVTIAALPSQDAAIEPADADSLDAPKPRLVTGGATRR